MKYNKYRVVNYFDVYEDIDSFGNTWIANNFCEEGFTYIDPDISDKTLLKKLHHLWDFIGQYPLKNIILESDGIMIELFLKDDYYPIGRLELIDFR